MHLPNSLLIGSDVQIACGIGIRMLIVSSTSSGAGLQRQSLRELLEAQTDRVYGTANGKMWDRQIGSDPDRHRM